MAIKAVLNEYMKALAPFIKSIFVYGESVINQELQTDKQSFLLCRHNKLEMRASSYRSAEHK